MTVIPASSPYGEGVPRRLGTTQKQRDAMLICGIAGLILGSSAGVAAFGSAVNGAVPGALVGVLVGFVVAGSEVNL